MLLLLGPVQLLMVLMALGSALSLQVLLLLLLLGCSQPQSDFEGGLLQKLRGSND
jgi:hypothetical protein